MEMEEKIQKELCRLLVLKKQLLAALESVSDREERLLLTYRYLNNESWEQIAVDLSVSMSSVHRIHASALRNFPVPNQS